MLRETTRRCETTARAVGKAVFWAGLSLVLSVGPSRAGDKIINVQGKLTDAQNNPLVGAHNMTFRLYANAGDATPAWSETKSVTLTNGLFNVGLGEGVTLDNQAFDRAYYLGIQVGSDPELSPRQPLGSSGHALGSRGDFNVSKTLSALDIKVNGTGGAPSIVTKNNNVGIGVADPLSRLDIGGPVRFRSNVAMHGLQTGNNLVNMGDAANIGMGWGSNDFGISALQNIVIGAASRISLRNMTGYGAGMDALIVVPGGNIGIGQSNPTVRLDVAGTVRAQTVSQYSSRALKTNIQYVNEAEQLQAIEKIKSLKPAMFHYTKDIDPGTKKPLRALRRGFIAEEVPPELLDETGTGISLNEQIFLLLEANRQLIKIVEALKDKVTALEAKTK